MPTYKPYPTTKDQPTRMNRKRARKEIYWFNKTILRKARGEKRRANRHPVTATAE